jgi:hypothetical protein
VSGKISSGFLLRRAVFVLLVFLLTLPVWWQRFKPKPIEIQGRAVDAAFEQEIREKWKPGAILQISSLGGEGDRAIAIAEWMLKNKVRLSVIDVCNSACPEYFLPAAAEVRFVGSPIVAFHWNLPITQEFLTENYPNLDFRCREGAFKAHQALVAKFDTNPDFWKGQRDRIGLRNITIVNPDDPCKLMLADLKVDLWFPTSEQLRDMMWLEFEGEVCADNKACIEKEIIPFSRKYKKIMVGDEVITISG